MASLFSYTIPFDDGAAPNPFRGMCSLAICKPGIRRTAQEGDWVVGLGSRDAPSGDLSGRLVYAMLVAQVISLKEYDLRAPEEWPHRIPNVTSRDLADRLGDCIYDFSSGEPPYQRAGVHGEKNRITDIAGKNVLLSADFYYFGSEAVELPEHLQPICHQGQGHKRQANDRYLTPFVHWVRNFGSGGQIFGWPDMVLDWSRERSSRGCSERAKDVEDGPVC